MNIVDIHAHPLLDRLYVVRDLGDQCLAQSCLFGKRLGIDVLKKGRVGVVVSSIYPMWDIRHGMTFLNTCHDAIQLIESHLVKHPDSAVIATKPGEIDNALAEGKIAFIHAVEGGHVLEGRLENVEKLYGWGVRSLTLTHFLNNDIAASTFDPRRKLTKHNGLTSFGCEVVTLMNTLGMVIDLAHCSEKAFWQVMGLTKHPVIVSHTGIRHFVPWEICLSDEQIKAIAQNGGVVGVILSALWLKQPQFAAGLGDLVNNIVYICNLVGADHVGIGSDFYGTPHIRGVETAGDFPRIWNRLSAAGLPDRDVDKIMGGNFLRLFRQVTG